MPAQPPSPESSTAKRPLPAVVGAVGVVVALTLVLALALARLSEAVGATVPAAATTSTIGRSARLAGGACSPVCRLASCANALRSGGSQSVPGLVTTVAPARVAKAAASPVSQALATMPGDAPGAAAGTLPVAPPAPPAPLGLPAGAVWSANHGTARRAAGSRSSPRPSARRRKCVPSPLHSGLASGSCGQKSSVSTPEKVLGGVCATSA